MEGEARVETGEEIAKQVADALTSKGISFGQILDFYSICKKHWDNKEDFKTWEVVRDIIIPKTRDHLCCYADIMDGGPKFPMYLISHSWSTTFFDNVLNIAADASGQTSRRLRNSITNRSFADEVKSCAYWMCIFAVNQHACICGTERNPCNCGRTKWLPPMVWSQIDKFHLIVPRIPGGVRVSLDTEFQTLTRVWVLFEIVEAINQKKEVRFLQENAASQSVTLRCVRECDATDPRDKERLLQTIERTLGFDKFNQTVELEVFLGIHQLLGLAVDMAAKSLGNISVLSRSHSGSTSDLIENYDIEHGTKYCHRQEPYRLAKNKLTGQPARIKSISFAGMTVEERNRAHSIAEDVQRWLTIDHPNIVRLLDFFVTPNCIYFIFESLDGPVVRGQQDEAAVAESVIQMVSALRHLHSHRIVHGNITDDHFVYEAVGSLQVKLLDFGGYISRPSVELAYSDGTLSYIAPEAIRDSVFTTKGDLWSLGVVVYKLLIGGMPFKGTLQVLIRAMETGQFCTQAEIIANRSELAMKFVHALLVADPETRLDSEKAFYHDWLQGKASINKGLSERTVQSLNSNGPQSKLKLAVGHAMSWSLPQEELEELEAQFLAVDIDRNGVVGVEELSKILGPAMADSLRDSLDVNGDGTVNYNEFLAAMCPSRCEHQYEMLADAFRRLDKDHSGKISTVELRNLVGEDLGEFDDMLAEIDSSGDGQVTLREFLTYMGYNSEEVTAGARFPKETSKAIVTKKAIHRMQPLRRSVTNGSHEIAVTEQDAPRNFHYQFNRLESLRRSVAMLKQIHEMQQDYLSLLEG